MGFYDERCMVSGVSLPASRAVLVPLGKTGVALYPIALPITGVYNRLGAIDMLEEDDNTALLLDYFKARLESGELVVKQCHLDYYLRGGCENLEQVLKVFERNVTQGEDASLLLGRRVLFALVCQEVWDAAVRAGTVPKGSNTDLFHHLFTDVPVAAAGYKGNLTKVSRHLRELSAVCGFLTNRGLAWVCKTEGGAQHYGEEMKRYLESARHRFTDCPEVLKALAEYRRAYAELLDDG